VPRSKPDKVVVHRIELGTLERTEMQELLASNIKRKKIDGNIAIGKAIGLTAVSGGAVYVLYQAYLLSREIAHNMALALTETQVVLERIRHDVAETSQAGLDIGEEGYDVYSGSPFIPRGMRPWVRALNPFRWI